MAILTVRELKSHSRFQQTPADILIELKNIGTPEEKYENLGAKPEVAINNRRELILDIFKQTDLEGHYIVMSLQELCDRLKTFSEETDMKQVTQRTVQTDLYHLRESIRETTVKGLEGGPRTKYYQYYDTEEEFESL